MVSTPPATYTVPSYVPVFTWFWMTAPSFSVRNPLLLSETTGSLAFTLLPSTVMFSSVSLALLLSKAPNELLRRNILPLVKLSARFRVPPPVMVMLAFAGITSVSVTSMVPVTVIVRVSP